MINHLFGIPITPSEPIEEIPQTYCVWWASAGCLPDSEYPAFVGTYDECVDYCETDPDGYLENLPAHNLYSFSIDTYEEDEDNE